uniref:CARD domain-containing protein n=1 Tax=Sphaeramia orbicularis TaxID=375764 RepID=A0A673CS67_9TELE
MLIGPNPATFEYDKIMSARYVIDLVRHKGPGACSYLIEKICELDPTLSQFLNLRTPDLV